MNETYGEIDQGVGVGGGGKSHQEDDDNLVLWVGNLDSRTTETMVYELFCQAGPILHIRLPKNPDGQGHKGYSFVTFQHEASVPYAINVMEGTTLFGKKLKLQPRPGSVHRKLMDQKKASEQRQDNNFQGQGQPQMSPQQQVPPPQQQWFHPQMAQVSPNMFLYQNQLYQSFTPSPNLNMNVMAIPFQPAAAAQIASPFVQQIPVQPPPGSMPSLPQQQQHGRNPRMQNGYNNYSGVPPQQQQQQLRTASPHQQHQQPPPGANTSHYNNGPQQMNGQGQHQQQYHHQSRGGGGGHYQSQRGGSRPPQQRNGGYSNGSLANNNSRMPYHQQQPRLSNPVQQQQQQYMMNTFQGQVPLVQSPDFRRGNPPPQQQQQQQNFPHGGQNYGNPPASNGFHNVHVYHY